jgi:uncharacterized integral membrane protein (TIGR00698 family)
MHRGSRTLKIDQAVTHRRALPAWRPEWTPGVILVVVLSLAATALGVFQERAIGISLFEPLVLGLLLGAVARNVLPAPGRFVAGANLMAKQVLEVGVGLLGASVDLRQILAAGSHLILLIVLTVVVGILGSYGVGRLLRLSHRQALLVAVGNAICGNSAIAAVAPVIGATKREVVNAIALTALLGVGLVLLLPLSLTWLGLDYYQYGVLAGMSVYAVPQVIAAAFPVSPLSGEVATLVKLSRVVLLGPVVLVLALLHREHGAASSVRGKWHSYVPWFVIMFLGLAVLRTLGALPEVVVNPTRELSRLLTLLAMAGLGFGVEVASVYQTGPRVGVAVVASLTLMVLLTLLSLHLLA